ncbi:hypothetical protein Nepgr_033797 [Nepenthes gracilis]|uniref:Uncharacterized protein n=1 Tax=Nepenthes gracilis TaxID=150966 RepID=A0AAD3TLA3_NEPGR|nr:hypothetical protein Nepgr_033797 [Nepenthes gracilis]
MQRRHASYFSWRRAMKILMYSVAAGALMEQIQCSWLLGEDPVWLILAFGGWLGLGHCWLWCSQGELLMIAWMLLGHGS